MNKALYIDDLWIAHIIPFIGPQLFRINELRSVCKQFTNVLEAIPILHLRVPSIEYPTIESAYSVIVLCMDKLSQDIDDENHGIPEIWLAEGSHENTIPKLAYPVTIRGYGFNRTIITNGLNFEIYNQRTHHTYLYNLGITNKTDILDLHESGINYTGSSEIFVSECRIFDCGGSGIRSRNAHINVSKSVIYNNDVGIHIWGKFAKFYLSETDIHHNERGITVGTLGKNYTNIIQNIKCHHNNDGGISVGGWQNMGVIAIMGERTDISYNNIVNKSSHSYGLGVSYSGKIYIVNLDDNISHHNYNQQNILPNMTENIIFVENLPTHHQ